MKQQGKNITRKEFIRTSSIGVIGAGVISSGSFSLLNSKSRLVTNQIGNTGIESTRLGMGATRTQEPGVIKAAIDGGIRFLDTGRSYARGKNEEMIGEVIKDFRKEITIQSKAKFNEDEIREKLRNESRKHVVSRIFNKSLEESLAALQTDYIDIMLYHGAQEIEPLYDEAVAGALEKAKKEGKIRAMGFSAHLNQANLVALNNKEKIFDVMMLAFNHRGGYVHSTNGRKYDWEQDALIKELKIAAAAGTGIIAMKTCSGGPCAMDADREPSLPQAVRWIITQDYIHSTAPAMANYTEVEEHISENLV